MFQPKQIRSSDGWLWIMIIEDSKCPSPEQLRLIRMSQMVICAKSPVTQSSHHVWPTIQSTATVEDWWIWRRRKKHSAFSLMRDISCNQMRQTAFIWKLESDSNHHAFHQSTLNHVVWLKACGTVTVRGWAWGLAHEPLFSTASTWNRVFVTGSSLQLLYNFLAAIALYDLNRKQYDHFSGPLQALRGH